MESEGSRNPPLVSPNSFCYAGGCRDSHSLVHGANMPPWTSSREPNEFTPREMQAPATILLGNLLSTCQNPPETSVPTGHKRKTNPASFLWAPLWLGCDFQEASNRSAMQAGRKHAGGPRQRPGLLVLLLPRVRVVRFLSRENQPKRSTLKKGTPVSHRKGVRPMSGQVPQKRDLRGSTHFLKWSNNPRKSREPPKTRIRWQKNPTLAWSFPCAEVRSSAYGLACCSEQTSVV